ncbi:MAG: hypothetical protein J6K29_12510 [Clostridia bacterium]|nr:hypothetical protein [Clostridia bacterium]
MYSVLEQARTPLRDGRGMTVFRRLYLCDTEADLEALPVADAPGSGALIAEGGGLWLLDHARTWRRANSAAALGGGLWKS